MSEKEVDDGICGSCQKKCKEDHEAIACDRCDQWFHIKCEKIPTSIYKLYVENNLDKNNFFWMCFDCRTEFTHSKVKITPTRSDVAELSPAIGTDVSKKPLVHVAVQHNGINSVVGDDSQQISQQICHYYRLGKCRHGKTGKKTVNGQSCCYLHPNKCLKYCRFGRDIAQGGCAGSCGLLHPTMCHNSLRFRQCLSQTCTFAHLQGTERFERKNLTEKINYSHPHPYKHEDTNSWYRPYMQHRSRHWDKNRSTNTFIGERPNAPTYPKTFMYRKQDFPELSSPSTESKLTDMSNTLIQVQKSIDFLMSLIPRSEAPPQPSPQQSAHLRERLNNHPPQHPYSYSREEAKN